MKTLDQIDIDGIIESGRYLSGEMTRDEMQRFERRLKRDKELQEDYRLACDVLRPGMQLPFMPPTPSNPLPASFFDARMQRKLAVGKQLAANAFWTVVITAVMTVFCAFLILMLK